MATKNSSAANNADTHPYPQSLAGSSPTLGSMINVLARDGAVWRELSNEALATLASQADSMINQGLASLRVVGDLILSHDPEVDEIDHSNVGCTVRTFAADLESLRDFERRVELELESRGFNECRSMLSKMARADA